MGDFSDGFRYSHYQERMPPPLGLHKEFPGPALRAITPDGKEDIDTLADGVLHGSGVIYRTARGAQNCAALQMNSIHQLGCENERFSAVFRIQPLITPTGAEHFLYTVGVTQF